MSAENTLNKVMGMLGFGKTEETPNIQVEMAQKKTADEQAVFDSENFAIGEAVSIVTPDGLVPVPQGEYVLEDGMEITVDGNGVIQEVGMPTEAGEEDPMMEAQNQPMKEQIDKATKPNPTSAKKVVKSKTEMEESYFSSDVAKKIADLEIKLASLESENTELMNRLNKEEAPRTHFSPEAQVQTSSMFKLGGKREESVQDRIFNQLF